MVILSDFFKCKLVDHCSVRLISDDGVWQVQIIVRRVLASWPLGALKLVYWAH